MCRLLFASIVTAMILPGLLFPPPADALYDNPPGIGEALNHQQPLCCRDITQGVGVVLR